MSKILVSVILVAAIVFGFVALGVAPVYAIEANITRLNTPTTVTAGQSFTVSLNVVFVLQPGQALWVMLQDSSGNQLPATVSCPAGSAIDLSTCSIIPSPFVPMPATVTVSFTLTAPSSDTTWSLKATAVIMDVNSSGNLQPVGTYSVKQFDVLVTGSQLQSTTQSRTTATPTNTIVTTSIASIPTQTSTSSTIPHYAFGWLLPVLLLAVAAIVTFTFVYYVLPMIRSRTTKPRVTEPRPVKSVAQRTEKATEDLFCFKCGARLKPHAEFCSKCGSAQA